MSTNKQYGKEAYVSPSIEIIRIENEGVIAASVGGTQDYTPVNPNVGRTNYNSASSSDLEDLINDVLTVEN